MKFIHYILDANKLAVPVANTMEWAKWFEDATRNRKRIVAQEDIGTYWVSTVFLGMNMAIMSDEPLLFETMIFEQGHSVDHYCDRCGTWEEAIDMHEAAVAQCMQWIRQLPVLI